jgi:hypothetical protein
VINYVFCYVQANKDLIFENGFLMKYLETAVRNDGIKHNYRTIKDPSIATVRDLLCIPFCVQRFLMMGWYT